jgi:3-hydroxyisobutyrate dehydrogenase-like beta-hydroxyacid dehydrogenase
VSAPSRVCLLGFGEVGTILADDFEARGVALAAWDVKFPEPGSGPALAAAARTVRVGGDARDAVRDADLGRMLDAIRGRMAERREVPTTR